ncbi:general secretion pathway protein GspB [Rhizobacter sp. SG703]|uniref:general secretion pathway protein GspB n=1 Tax=Rhizobacter sp. SG703 TaxID=2587140 RepID=UPI0014466816|nr:general secretion pathway protein GspB [Rhizobacter sp. SG703]NKI92865.1 general secretion pathway protein B [Rhizobacter sp. SG703]
MSYILDALRRADSERERGRVPGLHAQPASGTADDDDLPDGRGGMRWGFVASLLGLALVVVFAWMAFGRDKPIEVIVSAPPPLVQPQPVAPAPVATAVPTPEPVPAPVQEPVAAAAPATPAPERVAAAANKPQRKPAPAKREPVRAVPPPDEPKAVPLSELPEDVRRQLPTLAISGATYSASRANRMLIVNGQLYHEGDIVAPNLHLEQIQLKSAVLRYKSWRYSVGY